MLVSAGTVLSGLRAKYNFKNFEIILPY